MSIFKGINEASALDKGSTEMQAIYKGKKEIWTNNKVYYLGYGQEFDATSIKGYENFTQDNFFFIRTGSTAYNIYSNSGSTHNYCSVYYTNDYSNGIYTHFARANGNDNCTNQNYVVCCPTPEKLTLLGTGTVDVKALYPTQYQKFTVDNFLAKNTKTYWRDLPTLGDEDNTQQTWAQVQISYDQNTGIAKAVYYVRCKVTGGGGYDCDITSPSSDMPIYLYTGKIKDLE